MYCPKCGAQAPESAVRCAQCGEPMLASVQPVVRADAGPEEAARALHLHSLFGLFRSGMVKALMIWEIVGAVLLVVLSVLSILTLFSQLFLALLVLGVLGLAVAKCFIALGLRMVHHATFVDEARRGCQQVQWGLYLTIAATLFELLILLLTVLLFDTVRSAAEGVDIYQMVNVTSGWGVVLLILSTVISCVPYLLMAELLRRCSYNLWVLSDPTVSRQYIQVGGRVTAIVVAVSAVINLLSGVLAATGKIDLSSVISLVAQAIVAMLAWQFYKISKDARVVPEANTEE